MARNQAAETEARQPRGSVWRWWLLCLGVCLFAVTGMFTFRRVERFLMRDPRFTFNGPLDPGEESKHLHIEGAEHASRAEVINIFSSDFGRSLYEVPVAERRRRLLAVNWVKQAAVLRVWPNQIRVRIEERTPVAFVQVEADGGSSRAAMIDAEGEVVEPRNAKAYKLPVLTGIRESHNGDERKRRVRRMMKLVEEMGGAMDKISEVDAADAENLKVTQQIDGRAVVLILGTHGFRGRLDNFRENYPEIHKRMPRAKTFDLRLDDRITVVTAEAGHAE
jgi:cell division protein FtsQ